MTDDLKIIELQDLLDNANSQYKTVSAEAGRYKLLAEKLEQQLAECQAALALKHEELLKLVRSSRLSKGYFIEDYEAAVRTLDLQPGAEALERWLGEPVAWVNTDQQGGVMYFRKETPGVSLEPLYAKPKGIS